MGRRHRRSAPAPASASAPVFGRDVNLVLETERLRLILPRPAAAARVLAYFVDNDPHLRPWSPPSPSGYFDEPFWSARLRANREEYAQDISLRLFIFEREDEDGLPVGTCNFTGFSRGPFEACRLGYSLAARAQGKGYMTEALRAALDHVFEVMGFHRVEANYVPTNDRSGRVLRRLGFEVQGYARDYLFIDGVWRDHILTALTTPDPRPPSYAATAVTPPPRTS